jgi:hypothetical protein
VKSTSAAEYIWRPARYRSVVLWKIVKSVSAMPRTNAVPICTAVTTAPITQHSAAEKAKNRPSL